MPGYRSNNTLSPSSADPIILVALVDPRQQRAARSIDLELWVSGPGQKTSHEINGEIVTSEAWFHLLSTMDFGQADSMLAAVRFNQLGGKLF
jgi:hypothetical protein